MRLQKLSYEEEMKRRTRKKLNCTLDDSTFERLEFLADMLGISRSEIIDRAVKLYHKQIKKKLDAI